MAAKKKKAVRAAKASRRPAKPVTRKAAPKKAKRAAPARKAVTANAKTKTAAKKKSWIARAVSDMGGLITGRSKAKKKPAVREFGEGNYKASQRFRAEEEAFVKKNRKRIPKLGKAAEAALEGPEGDALRAAEADAASHAAGKT